jgi:hypothetical protein
MTSLESLVPELREWARALVDFAGTQGLLPQVTSTLRTRAEQTRLFRRWQRGEQLFGVARPGTSAHEYGEAFDLVVTPFEYLRDLGAIWKRWGGGWAARDPVHFELPGASAYYAKFGALEAQSKVSVPWYLAVPIGAQKALGTDFGTGATDVLDLAEQLLNR